MEDIDKIFNDWDNDEDEDYDIKDIVVGDHILFEYSGHGEYNGISSNAIVKGEVINIIEMPISDWRLIYLSDKTGFIDVFIRNLIKE